MKTKRTPKGINPGFAYNPGKAWQEPKTVPPLPAEYEAVLQARRGLAHRPERPGPARPALPTPTPVARDQLLPAHTPTDVATAAFMADFGRLQ